MADQTSSYVLDPNHINILVASPLDYVLMSRDASDKRAQLKMGKNV